MKNVKLKLAVLATLGLVSVPAMSAMVNLPSTGTAVVAGTNQPAGTTAYVTCNNTGNYGSTQYNMTGQTACVTTNANSTTSPDAAVPTLFQSNTAVINANGVALATKRQNNFRNAASTQCVFGTQFTMNLTSTFDYNANRAGSNTLEVNDVAFAGFSNTPTVQAGYNMLGAAVAQSSPIFRVGRSHTSVQMHANAIAGASVAATFVHRPITASAPAASTQINGPSPLGTEPYPNTASAAQQAGALSPNWVIFTQDLTGGADEDNGLSTPTSAWMYIEAACNNTNPAIAGTPAAVADAIVLRQVGQETQPWVTIKIPSAYAPVGTNATLY